MSMAAVDTTLDVMPLPDIHQSCVTAGTHAGFYLLWKTSRTSNVDQSPDSFFIRILPMLQARELTGANR